MKNKRFLILTIVVLWVLAYTFNSQQRTSSSNPKSKVEALPYINFQAPEFSLTSLDGRAFNLKQAEGKPVIINFWASWCGPCNLEAPELSQMYKKYKGQFTLYAINLTDLESSLNDVKHFAQHYGYQFPVLLDKHGTISKLYQIKPIPTTFFLNSNGQIVDEVMGYGGSGVLEEKFKKVLKLEGQK